MYWGGRRYGTRTCDHGLSRRSLRVTPLHLTQSKTTQPIPIQPNPIPTINHTLSILFERSEFLVSTSKKKKLTVCVCVDVRLILVLVWKNCLGFSVGYQRAPGWFKCEKLKAISQFMPLWRRGLNHQTMKSKFASSIPVLGTSSFFFPFFFLHGRWCPLYVPFFWEHTTHR